MFNIRDNITAFIFRYRFRCKPNIMVCEDFWVDYVPHMLNFTDTNSDKIEHITNLNPEAEHIYFDNLELCYTPNNLIKKTEMFWLNPGEKPRTARIHFHKSNNLLFPDALRKETKMLYMYRLKDDTLTNYCMQRRQWFKRYEENALFIQVYKNAVIIRNEYRLFCINIFSGEEIWSFGNIDRTGHEFYQSFHHPHHNSFGYELLLAKGTIFTELDGMLLAISLEDISVPRILWKQYLGPFTLCTTFT
ncbi:MAG: hypothetical protein KKH94_13040, partial [Candidatus Omnitrophica bacterium]|nr:hypothetical protein [Candidatus Omnitrophota bacterium]